MPYRTEHGTHYHMKEGCNGATIQCGTEGLTPCSICCGGKGGSATETTAGAGVASPASGPTTESMEAADRWRRNATESLFGTRIDLDSIKNRGKRITYEEWEEQRRADAELDAMMAAADSPDYDFDEMADDAFPFGDGGRYSLYGSSDSFPDVDEVADQVVEAGMGGVSSGMEAPDMTVSEMADSLAQARPIGTTPEHWNREAKFVAEVAGIPKSSDGVPTVLMGQVGNLYVFETSHTSTSNPNNPYDHFGGWLFDVKEAHIIAPDGTDLSRRIETVRTLSNSIGKSRADFMERCRKEAAEIAKEHSLEVHQDEVQAAIANARSEYERDVVEPWRRGYGEWRAANADRAEAMAEDMRRNRPASRHRYIEGDVEERMRKSYERSHPCPAAWSYTLPEYQDAMTKGHEHAGQVLAEEGWDEDKEYQKALNEVIARRDPTGRNGVPEAMHRNYEAAMRELEKWPESKTLMDAKLTWGATKGMPVKTPDEWKKMFGQGK